MCKPTLAKNPRRCQRWSVAWKGGGMKLRWRQVQDVWQQLDGIDIRILETVLYYQKKYSVAFPSRYILAQRAGCNESTISRHVTKLKHLGVLWVTYRKYRRKNGTWQTRSNVYRLLGCVGAKLRQV